MFSEGVAVVPFAEPACDEGAVLVLIHGGGLLTPRASWDLLTGEGLASRWPWEVFTERELVAIFHHVCAQPCLLPVWGVDSRFIGRESRINICRIVDAGICLSVCLSVCLPRFVSSSSVVDRCPLSVCSCYRKEAQVDFATSK